MRLEIISGSSRQNSLSRRVAIFLQRYFKENTAHEIGLIDMKDWDLPQLDTVFTSVEKTPVEFKELSRRIFRCRCFYTSLSRIQWQLLSRT